MNMKIVNFIYKIESKIQKFNSLNIIRNHIPLTAEEMREELQIIEMIMQKY